MTSSLCLAGLPSDLLIHVASFLPQPKALLETCKGLYALRDRPELLTTWLVRNSIRHAHASDTEQLATTVLQRFSCTQAHAELLRSLLGESPIELWFPGLQQALQHVPNSLGNWIVAPEHAHQAPCHALRWLAKAAGAAGSIPVLCWCFAIDTALPAAAFTTLPDLTPHIEPLPSKAIRLSTYDGIPNNRHVSPSHYLLSHAARHSLQRVCDEALRAAAASGHVLACKLLLDHTMADEQAVLGMLAEADDAAALQLLLRPRPQELILIASNTRELQLQFAQLFESAAQQGQTLPTPDTAGAVQTNQQVNSSRGWQSVANTWPSHWGFGVKISSVERFVVPKAARAGALNSLRTLLAQGASPFLGVVPAAESGAADALQLLLDDIGRIVGGEAQRRHAATRAMFNAARNGHVGCVKTLIRMGADATAENQHALVDACVSGNAEVVELLLDHGCSAGALQGVPLATAALQGYTDVVRVLLRRGADPNCLNHHPLTGAACNGHEEVVRLLLKAGADPHAKEEEALNQAAHNGHIGCAQIIVQYSSALRAANHKRAAMQATSSRGTTLDSDIQRSMCDAKSRAVTSDSSGAQSRCSHAAQMPATGVDLLAWPTSKLSGLRQLLARCPDCPLRTNPFQPVPPEHTCCPSGNELWEAARAELAANSSTVFGWYSIFCDGCNSLPVVGRRWRCRDCPRYYMETLPSLQGFDLCDDCYNLRQHGKPLPLMPPHPTHCHNTHRLVADRAPLDWNADLDKHSQVLVWLNCYEALHPEVDGHQLHHLAVMHVNRDPRRTQISTENLISILAPGTTPRQWQSLLPPVPAQPRRRTTSTGGAAASTSTAASPAATTTELASHPIADMAAPGVLGSDVGDPGVSGGDMCDAGSDEDAAADEDDNVWPSMPPPGYQPVLLWNQPQHDHDHGAGEGLGDEEAAAGGAVGEGMGGVEGGDGQDNQEGGNLVQHVVVGAMLAAVEAVLGHNDLLENQAANNDAGWGDDEEFAPYAEEA